MTATGPFNTRGSGQSEGRAHARQEPGRFLPLDKLDKWLKENCNNSHGDVHLSDRLGQGCCDGTQADQESTEHDNWTITKAVTHDCRKWSCKGHDKDTDGNNPRHSAVGFTKAAHEVLKEDPKNLDDAIGKNFHEEEGDGHHPAPATIWHFGIYIGARAALKGRRQSCHGRRWGFKTGRADTRKKCKKRLC